MLKVLFVFNHPAPYKVKFLNELAKHTDLTVIFERDKNANRNNLFYSEHKCDFKLVKVHGLKLGNENIISSGVKKHIQNNQYDLIIMNGYSNFAEMSAIKYMKNHNIEYALYINGGIIKVNEPEWKRKLKTKYIEGAKFYFSPDERSNEYLKYYGADKNKIFNYPYSTIYENEIIKDKPSKEQIDDIKKEYGINSDKIFVSSGQLISRKNYLGLVKAWKDLPSDYELIIAGDGKQRNKIMDFLRKNNMKNVILTGFLNKEKMFKLFSISKAFVFPSKEDIYGHVINEAMSQGIPTISTNNVNSSLHLIKESMNGFIIEDINSKKFIDALNYTLSNDMFDNCVKTAKDNTIEKMTEVNLKIIKENT